MFLPWISSDIWLQKVLKYDFYFIFFLIVADLTILAALLCTFQSFQEG